MPVPVVPEDVLAAIDAACLRSPLALDLHYLDSTTSTMDLAGEAVNAGAPEGYAVIAGEQTAGRGRRGRVWQSPPGAGLYCSMVFRPGLSAEGQRAQSLLTLAAGVAARRAIGAATGLWPDLKWPNDLLVGRRKLAGILAEGHNLGSHQAAVVVGVGVNILQAVLDSSVADRSTSLEAELGRAVPRGAVLEHLLVALAAAYDQLRRGESDAILREWRMAAPSAVGARVEWDSGPQVRHGTTAGIDADGALLIRTATATERFVGGELRWS
jgi:BirA family transcriptional regulator, biotin operon repressor / biotin---[acetyl-CoA-carboxylase] ligase